MEVIKYKVGSVTNTLLASLFAVSRRSLSLTFHFQKTKDELLKDQILKVLEFNPSYGHRRLALALGLGKRRVRRVMRLYGIKPYKRKARWVKRRDLRRPDPGYPNLIKGSCPIKPGVVYVGDFTYLRWQGKIIYFATFMDLYTREIVGWSISAKHTKELVIEAFLDAVRERGKPTIVHTDQGSEYCSKEYQKIMDYLGVKISMSKKASPWENAYQESFYNNFKTDLGLEFDRFQTLGELIEGIHQVVNYYNNFRIHLALKMPPEQFRLTHSRM